MGCTQSAPKVVKTLDSTKEKGVSIHHLQTIFLDHIQVAGYDKSSTIYDLEDLSLRTQGFIRKKGAQIKDPLDGRLGASYVDCLQGRDNVGPANFMLSYSCAYTIGDIIDALEEFCRLHGRDPKRTYVWMCCLCINQHRVVERVEKNEDIGLKEFQGMLQHRIAGIGKFIAILFPWDKPIYLERIWCIYEMSIAKNENCQIFIAMPPKERRKMAHALAISDGYEKLLDVLEETKIQNASASRNIEKVRILDLIQKGPGFDEFHNQINILLRDWIKEGIMLAVNAVEEDTENPSENVDFGLLLGQLGVVLDRTDSYDLSLKLHRKTLDIFMQVYGESNHEVASAHHNVGRALFKTGDFDGALEHYRKVLTIDQKIAGDEHPDTATSLANIADILKAQGKYDEAEKDIERSLHIRRNILGIHPDTAKSHSQLGLLYHIQMKYDEALAEHEKALEIALELLGENHQETATIYHNTGGTLMEKGDYNNALINFEKALAIYKYLLGENHSKTHHTITWIEMCKESMVAAVKK